LGQLSLGRDWRRKTAYARSCAVRCLSQALADLVKSEIAKWTPIIKAAGVKAE